MTKKEYRHKYYWAHKKQCSEESKRYQMKHEQELKHKAKKQRATVEYRAYRRLVYKQKYRDDISYKLLKLLRSRIYKVMKETVKSKTSLELLGCSLKQLQHHLEKQFKKGMSWDNYGKWHIDHIQPCVSFDLRKPSEQRKCFNYRNLQPLWAKENLRKNGKHNTGE
jgi:hypothetical protein